MDTTLEAFATSVSGTVIRGVRGGQGPPALLLHGSAGSWRNFRDWIPTLQTRCHLVVPDIPGFGESPAPSLTPTLPAWAGLMRELAVTLGVIPKVLVGLGMGASLALAYLTEVGTEGLPKRVVLHTPAYYPGAVRPKARWGTRFLASPLIFPLVAGILGHPAVRQQFVRRLTAAPSADDHSMRLLLEDVDRASLRVFRGLARDMVRSDFRPLLRRMQVPTLAMVAEHDPFVYATEVMKLNTWIEDVRVIVQRDVAHGWTASAIEQQNALLAEFLSPSTS